MINCVYKLLKECSHNNYFGRKECFPTHPLLLVQNLCVFIKLCGFNFLFGGIYSQTIGANMNPTIKRECVEKSTSKYDMCMWACEHNFIIFFKKFYKINFNGN